MATVISDNPFKKQGSIPFKWETRPGVSKFHEYDTHEPPRLSSSSMGSTSFDSLAPSKELQMKWLQSMALSSHNKKRASMSLTRLGLFSGQPGCFSFSWARLWKWGKERKAVKPRLKMKLVLDHESLKENTFILEKLAQWAISAPPRSSTSSYSARIQTAARDQPSYCNDEEADQCVFSNDHGGRSSFSNDDEADRLQTFNRLFGFMRRPKMLGMGGIGRDKNEIKISVYVVNKKN